MNRDDRRYAVAVETCGVIAIFMVCFTLAAFIAVTILDIIKTALGL